MIGLTPNIPEVVTEVRDLVERYERALVENYIELMDATYWNSPYTIRFGPSEHGWGFDQIHAHRVRRAPGAYGKESRRLEILTLGRTFATVNIEYKVRGRDMIGRQSQAWVHFPEGWKVVSARASWIDTNALH